MISYLAILALQAGSIPVPPMDPARIKLKEWTPEEITREAAEFDCSIEMEDGARLKLILNRSGGRGFRHPKTGNVDLTDIKIATSGSGADRFSNYSFIAGNRDDILLIERGKPKTSWEYNLDLVETASSYAKNLKSRYAITLKTNGWPNGSHIFGIGFCRAAFHSQGPLSSSEAQIYIQDSSE